MVIKRKIDRFLSDWRSRKGHLPLIVKGTRQVGKTFSIEAFAAANYSHFVNINFVLEPKYRSIFDDGYDVDSIIKTFPFYLRKWK